MDDKNMGKMLSPGETASFCSQMDMILKAGISSLEGIQIMQEDASSQEEKAILEQMNQTLMETGSFSKALEATHVFPDYLLKMTEIGEYSGHLDDVMGELTHYYKRENDLAQAIRSAITYPMVMTSMMLMVVLLLITKVLPVFQQVFQQLGLEVKGVSAALMSLGMAMNRYAIIVIGVLIIILISLVLFSRVKKGKEFFTAMASRIGISRKIQDKTATCRFAGGLAITLKSGLPMEEGIKMASSLCESMEFQKKVDKCLRLMEEEGKDLNEALVEAGIFSGLYARMINVAAKTGHVDEIMGEVAEKYQEEVDQQLTSVIAILEPSLVAVVSIVTGLILLSVMLPLMGVLTGI